MNKQIIPLLVYCLLSVSCETPEKVESVEPAQIVNLGSQDRSLGKSVSISDGTIAVGGYNYYYYNGVNGTYWTIRNSIRIFKQSISGQWVQVHQLLPESVPDGSLHYAVALSNGYLFDGHHVFSNDADSLIWEKDLSIKSYNYYWDKHEFSFSFPRIVIAFKDSVFVYRNSEGNWIQEFIRTSADSVETDYQPHVATSGDWIILAANTEAAENPFVVARAYKYESGSWNQSPDLKIIDPAVKKLSVPFSIAISEDHVMIGMAEESKFGTIVQSIQVFRINVYGSWIHTQTIHEPTRQIQSGFGATMKVFGSYLLVGAPGESHGQYKSGAAYLYQLAGDTWVYRTRIVADDMGPGDLFGSAIAIDDKNFVITAPGKSNEPDGTDLGRVYIYELEN